MSTRRVQALACYRADGIIAKLAGDEVRWSEGNVDFSFEGKGGWIKGDSTTSMYMAIYELSFPHASTPQSTFRENLLKYVDYANQRAIWNSNAETRQYVTATNRSFRFDIAFAGVPWNGKPMYINAMYFPPLSNQDLTNVKLLTFSCTNEPDSRTYTTVPDQDDPTINILRREIVSKKHELVCLTCGSMTDDRGFNSEDIRDWCNDYTNLFYTHTDTYNKSTKDLFPYWEDSQPALIRWRKGSSTSNWTVQDKTTNQTNAVEAASDKKKYQKKPYFGYVTTIDNWNKIYTDAFTAIARDIETNTGVTLTSIDGKKCVGLAQGIPLCAVGNGETVELPIEFEDTTKNYVFWIKRGPFTIGTAPDSESDLVTNGQLNNVEKTDSNKYWSINGNISNTIKFKNDTTKTFYFVKWALASDHNGGGVWLPPEEVTIEKDN